MSTVDPTAVATIAEAIAQQPSQACQLSSFIDSNDSADESVSTAFGGQSEMNSTSLWANRSWRWLCSAVVVSVMGDLLSSVAVTVYLLERGSEKWLSAYFITFMASRMVFSAPMGKLADRVNRVTMMVVADVIRGITFLGLAVAMANDAPVWAPIVAIGISAMVASGARAAYMALVVMVVDDAQLPAANAAEAACHQAGWLAGPIIGAAVASAWGAPVAVTANAVTFAVSAVLMSQIRPRAAVEAVPVEGPDAHTPALAADGGDVDIRSVVSVAPVDETHRDMGHGDGGDSDPFDSDAQATSTAISVPRTVWALMVVGAGVLFLFGVEMVAQPLVIESVLGRKVAQVGWLIAATGAAGLLTAPIAPRLMGRVGVMPSLWISTLVAAAALAALTGTGQLTNPLDLSVAMGLAAVGGAAGMMFEVAVMTGLQQAVPDDVLGATTGRFESIGSAATLAGLLAVPALSAVMSVANMCVTLAGVVAASVAVSVLVRPTRSQRIRRQRHDRAVHR
jgi:MFS family permease